KTISEFARVLRPGGCIITTAPFVFPIHDAHDYFRYSPDGLAAIMKRNDLFVEKVEALSGTAVTIALIFNLYWFTAIMWTKWLYPLGLILRPLLLVLAFLVNVIGGIFEVLLPSRQLSFGHLTIASKK